MSHATQVVAGPWACWQLATVPRRARASPLDCSGNAMPSPRLPSCCWLLLLIACSSSVRAQSGAPLDLTPRAWQGQPPAPAPPPPTHTLSLAVYPAQDIPLAFSHARHLRRGATCLTCHPAAATATTVAERLLPSEDQCRACHAIDRSRPQARLLDTGPPTACRACHLGLPSEAAPGLIPDVPRVQVPPPQLKFNHRMHADQRIDCATCHGDLSQVDLAGRAHLPAMRVCLRCHTDRAPTDSGLPRRKASARCVACHPAQSDGTLITRFPSGSLVPSGEQRGDAHTLAFFLRHQQAAQADRPYCESCHTQSSCLRCHAGVVKPMDLHGGNYLARHAVEARRNQPDCASCHRAATFCLACHERLGLASHDTLPGRPPVSAFYPAQPRRFHPPGWSAPAFGSPAENVHAIEARRSPRTCVSCHREDTCLACHSALSATRLPGGQNPHGPGWISSGRCAALAAANLRTCLTCHAASSTARTCTPGAP